MIKVGFVTSVLNTGSAGRGIGVYTTNLLHYLQKYCQDYNVSIAEITNNQTVASDFDIVHYPFFDLFYHTLPLLRTTKTIVTCHDVIPLEFPDHYPPGIKGNINLFIQKMGLLHASAVLTDSFASLHAIRKYLGVDHSRLKMIYLGPSDSLKKVVDKKVLNLIRKKYHLPEKFVLNVGDVNWNKNIPGLIIACEKNAIPLVLVGKSAVTIDSMDTSHSELHHISILKEKFKSKQIFRLGYISDEDFAAVCTLATVYCQTSYAEGFGFSVLHALICGTPVACSNSHSLPEVAGNSAVYFDPFNQGSINSGLHTLLNDTSLRQTLSESGQIQAKKFSWDKAAQETLTIYKQVFQSNEF